ncbi:MAG: MFS transporter [Agathobacter sp.]|nr:MFS transporter [Agathobacter sp.]
MKKHKTGWLTSKGERLSYYLFFAGQLIFNTIVMSYVLTLLLNNGVNEVLAGAIILAPKIWDAVNDTLFGFIVDKVRFKGGRFLPWIKLSAILMPIATIFLFSVPETMSVTGKCIWIVIGYILWDTSYTISDTPIYALSTSMTNNMDERTTILSLRGVTGAIGGLLAAVLIPLLYGQNGANLGWSVTAIIVSVIGLACMLPVGFVAKERFDAEKEEEASFKELFAALIQNKNLFVIIGVRFIFLLTYTVQVLNPIFCEYVMGNETIASLLALLISVPSIVLSVVLPMLCRRFDKVHMLVVFMVIFAVPSILQYFIGYESLAIFLLITTIRAIGYAGFTALIFMFIPDCIEYGQYTTGQRNAGTSFCLQTFVSKLNSAIISSLTAFIIAAMGFSATNVTEAGKDGVWFTYTIFTAIGSIIAIPLLLKFYTIRDKDVKEMIACNNGEITKEECEKRLSK